MTKYINLVKKFSYDLDNIYLKDLSAHEEDIVYDLKSNLKRFKEVLELRYWLDFRKK